MTESDAQIKFDYLCRIGDTVLVLGQQLSAWCGHAPALEEDIAVANTALDLVGQAKMWLTYAGEIEAAGRDDDQLAFFRESREYKNALLVEQRDGSHVRGDFGATLMRQFLFDAWHVPMLAELEKSDDDEIAAIAGKAIKEARYHLSRSQDLVIRLGQGTQESHSRMQDALDQLWPFTGELVMADATDSAAQDAGHGADLEVVGKTARQNWGQTLAQAGLNVDDDVFMRSGGKTGMHGEGLGYILAEMQSVARIDPDARW